MAVCVSLRQIDIEGFDGQSATSSHGVTSVESQVHQHLFQLAVIGLHSTQSNGEIGHQLDVLTQERPEHAFHSGDDLVEAQDLPCHELLPAEAKELPGELHGAIGGLSDLV